MKKLDRYLSRAWAEGKLKQIAPFLPPSGRMLDIGSGRGTITGILRRRGYGVTPLDIRDRSIDSDLRPLLYDGEAIPFPDDSFDCALLLTVLHHTPDPVAVLREAARVAPQLIIIEDVFSNSLQKQLTFFTDSLFNCEFRGHPHSNRRDGEWRRVFEQLELTLAEEQSRRVLLFYRQQAYNVLRK
ncbi:MAG: class I SAM-dependent methyltransferase [Spirochaetaceae bacterium]|nr:MAG: class I SAM-dependent methyltransferase [Spirochaetaceae bacterium]